MYLVVYKGNVVAENLDKPTAVDMALKQNGFHHQIIRDPHGQYNLHLKTSHDGPPHKTQFGSALKSFVQAVEDIYTQVYAFRYLYDLQIYTPEEFKHLYQTVIK